MWLVVLAMLNPFGFWAQTGTVTGQVNAVGTREARSTTQVFVQGLDIGGLRQANGWFVIDNVPTGLHTVTAQRVGHVTQDVDVTMIVGQTVVVDLQMEDQAIALDEIVVTGAGGRGTQRRAIGDALGRMDFAVRRRLTEGASESASRRTGIR